ncbi:MAG: class II glutamine amidotransferase [Myxococcaceae bacterium]|nr:class II glutamine amidotransferase [Myxococcaceae bacterium]
MCRLFAVASSEPVRLHRAFAALRSASHEHKDGWGLAAFDGGSAELQHGTDSAHVSADFARLGAERATRRALVHIRLASVGKVSVENAHPFQRAGWVFMHNGTVKHFAERRDALLELIAPHHRAAIKGETDSEHCFALFLTELERHGPHPTPRQTAQAIGAVMHTVARLFDAGCKAGERSSLNFLASNGPLMVASRRGRTLFVAGDTRRRLIASDPLWHDDDWSPLAEDELAIIDGRLELHRLSLAELS